MRDIVQSIAVTQERLITHRQDQAAALLKRRITGRKKRKISPDESQASDESQSQSTGSALEKGLTETIAVEYMAVEHQRSVEDLVKEVLLQSLVRIGRDRWTTLRTRGQGRLSYNRIQVSTMLRPTFNIEEPRRLIIPAMRRR